MKLRGEEGSLGGKGREEVEALRGGQGNEADGAAVPPSGGQAAWHIVLIERH